MTDAAAELLDRISLSLHTRGSSRVVRTSAPVPLAARSGVGPLAWASVAAVSLAAASLSSGGDVVDLRLDPARIAVAYSSEKYFRVDGASPDVWAPLSGFFRSSDGWVRTHGNYAHHAEALRQGLGLASDAGHASVALTISGMTGAGVARAITAAGGVCVEVAHERPDLDAEFRRSPILASTPLGCAPSRARWSGPPNAPLRGIRVLDLTRVIAGPVATRTLALLGADVLRVDPPWLPEPQWQHWDTGHGKRSTLLSLNRPHGRALFDALVADADVVVTGYRPGSIDKLGIGPRTLALQRPGLVIARLSAWGSDGQNADRRGFDSVVQAASGLSWVESRDALTPGALPAQALDHSAGYLLAAGIITALRRQRHDGGTWLVETSLRRIAAELLGMPRGPVPALAITPEGAGHTVRFEVDGREVITAGPAFGELHGFRPPRPYGRDRARWLPR